MKKIFNEFGISLVFGKGNWVGFSYEIEEGKNEIRGLGWKKIKINKIKDIYFRFQILKKVLILSKIDGIKFKNKDKYGLKIIIGFSD